MLGSLLKSLISSKFVLDLLKLEQEHPASVQLAEKRATRWTPSFQGVGLSDFFSGFKLTPNFLFFVLFLGFFLWLFIIYWVRHNEPLADMVLGTPKAGLSSEADRKLVANIKKTFPVRTSSSTGEIYVPGLKTINSNKTEEANNMDTRVLFSKQENYSQENYSYDSAFGSPNSCVEAQGQLTNQSITYRQPYVSNYGFDGHYVVGVRHASGTTKARTIVSR